MSNNHENDLSLGRRYKKYEGAYNLAFAADPDTQLRRFDEMAPKDDQQWKRLEVFRGNDREAYHAHKSNPNDALVRPTEKEQRMWEANQADMWRIDREPSFGQHAMTNNKWFDLSLEQRRGESTQKFFHAAEQRYGGDYEAWAAKAGNNVVAREDYLQTRAGLEIEQRQAAQQQKMKEAQAQEQRAQQAASVQPTPQASPEAQEQAAAGAPRRTRLSLLNFATPEDGIAQLHKEMSQLPAEQVKQRSEQAEVEHQAMGKGRTEDAAPRVEALNAYHAEVQEAQQQERRQRQEAPAQVETQRRTYQQ
ncbi:hypothetical protein FKV24_000640 [Lysobacter maris]|uniref:Uncharacterized protein n=1 Tax=Marilutibacter maris TaxID=1605891 RepID=A0A508B376_9GAMM|nr:hypothetical protein [Lysobacter maris]KAB8198706.1 hypothetical protein FKV24_000640 [Lysobacter maris]